MKNFEKKCPMRTTLQIIGGKWKPLILQEVKGEVKRFSDFQRAIPEVTKQMLTKNLRELEEDGIVLRTVYAVVPPRVEYSLTPKGQSLMPVLESMASWGMDHLD